jgi:primosomal protein N'
MFIVEVSPLLKGANLESLSYYSTVSYEPGTLLKIPVRSKEATGLVISSKPVSAARAAVRAATFSLRKLPEQVFDSGVSSNLADTAMELTKEVPASFGSILFSLLPPEVRDGDVPYPITADNVSKKGESTVTVLTDTFENRFVTYKSRVREAFAHRGSVLFVAPTAHLAMEAAEKLLLGIKDRAVILTPALTEKSRRKAYENFTDLSVSKLIVTTPTYAFLDRHDITDIIIEESASPHYRSRTRPYLDYKRALLKMAEVSGRRVLLGDLLHRSEDEYFRRQDIYMTEGEEFHRVVFQNSVRVIGAKDKPDGETPFQLLSPQLRGAITKTIDERQNVFMYAARRGLAPVVACADCGHIFRDPHSGTPYSLFRTFKDGEEKRWFLSSTSGRRVRAADTCPHCGSWRLRERGIGIQYIEDELNKHFPEAKLFVFDHSTANTERKANAIMAAFYETKGAILLGTSMAVPYLNRMVALCAVVSLDSLRAVPTWRADEQSLGLLLHLRELAEEELLLQTRNEPDELPAYLKSGQISQFFNDELALRAELNYPPFAHLVHLTMSGKEESVKLLEKEVSDLLQGFNFSFYSSPDSTPEKTTRYALLRVALNEWPHPELMDLLRSLSPAVRIEVDPDRLV